MILHNERIVKLSPEGLLTYYHVDTPSLVKDQINLKHSSVIDIRFVYAGRWPALQQKSEAMPDKNARPLPHTDDEMRLYTKSGNFFFKSMSKI